MNELKEYCIIFMIVASMLSTSTGIGYLQFYLFRVINELQFKDISKSKRNIFTVLLIMVVIILYIILFVLVSIVLNLFKELEFYNLFLTLIIILLINVGSTWLKVKDN